MPPTRRVNPTFAVSPRFDLFYALYDLTDDGRSSSDEWQTGALKKLPARFKSVADEVAPRPIFWPLFADTLRQARGELSFEEMLAALRRMPAAEVRSNVLSGIFHDPATVAALVDEKRSLRRIVEESKPPIAGLLTHFGLRPYDAASSSIHTISRLLTHPAAFRDDLVTVLHEFWRSMFRTEWDRLQPALLAQVASMREVERSLALEEFASQLRLPVTFDDRARTVRVSQGQAIPYDRIQGCFILPSAFNTRRWWAKYEMEGARVDLYFPVFRRPSTAGEKSQEPVSAVRARKAPTKIRAELVFRALGDTTRYAIASILARDPTTSAELSRRLGVSKPTITHHIQTLRAAGLINESPTGGPTKLSLNRDILASLSEAALDQLFSGSGDLPLDTTRKRRSP